jgi:hypothetical protein
MAMGQLAFIPTLIIISNHNSNIVVLPSAMAFPPPLPAIIPRMGHHQMDGSVSLLLRENQKKMNFSNQLTPSPNEFPPPPPSSSTCSSSSSSSQYSGFSQQQQYYAQNGQFPFLKFLKTDEVYTIEYVHFGIAHNWQLYIHSLF